MEMQISRKLNYSFMYFLMEELSIAVDKKLLTRVDDQNYMIPHANIVFTKPIDVFIDGVKVNKAQYRVYPLKSKIFFFEKVDSSSNITATYNYSIVNIIGHTEEELIKPPLLALESTVDTDYPYELGSSLSDIEVLYFIHLYGANQAQRDDLCDIVKMALRKTLYIRDYSKGFPLASDGSLRDMDIPIINRALFEKISVRKNPLNEIDEIEIGRALIAVTCRYIN